MLSRFHLVPERNGQTDGFARQSVCWRAIKTGLLQLISHNFTNSQRVLTIFGTEIPYSILQ